MSIFKKLFNKSNLQNNWPDDADGDVLRRMEESGFNFSKTHIIDFNVDLKEWPPSTELIDVLKNRYGEIETFEPSDDDNGYLQFQIKESVTYDLVMKIQKEVSQLTESFGGRCESWGVMQD